MVFLGSASCDLGSCRCVIGVLAWNSRLITLSFGLVMSLYDVDLADISVASLSR